MPTKRLFQGQRVGYFDPIGRSNSCSDNGAHAFPDSLPVLCTDSVAYHDADSGTVVQPDKRADRSAHHCANSSAHFSADSIADLANPCAINRTDLS